MEGRADIEKLLIKKIWHVRDAHAQVIAGGNMPLNYRCAIWTQWTPKKDSCCEMELSQPPHFTDKLQAGNNCAAL